MQNYIYILIMSFTLFLIRVLPITIFRKEIKNEFAKSFLFYVPYVTLAVMTFPAIIDSCENKIAGLVSLVFGIVASYKGLGLAKVTVICCVIVFAIETFL